ncbi:uncharacterized protein PITG_08363 [Phytophthora infestans T30-4]|uniref:WW domain-containing protein n=1 Tax=Phytophthora infestans (strain T30-4) TaxID=403677 RepID=D0NAF0_PHYIT|nr:uncharacterized protein PITG_08363 [Phytophthora infestans T30-4]EEY54808.1 conserved hypothetical protein [Phytophthora infestans T30-4]|eukprot:XP_002903753.1 conserved hypothetical protein [Phytophthora infestans T30-4]
MRSFFSKRNAGTQAPKRKKKDEVSADGVPVVFKGDESLVQLHAETAELLRLVKTPVKTPKKNPKVGTGTSSKEGKTRLTIEVLDDDDEENQDDTKPKNDQDLKSPLGPASPIDPIDPSAFDAEETRIRQAKDTFYPDMRPSKHSVEWQKGAFQREQNRQEDIDNGERRRTEQTIRNKQRKRDQPLENRLETSATLIQAQSRGFLCRRRWRDHHKATVVANSNNVESEGDQWHEVRDVERGEVWYYNATTGVSQWEPPVGQITKKSLSRTTQLSSLKGPDALPPLSPSCSSARSTSSDQELQRRISGTRRSIEARKSIKSPRNLPALQPESIPSSPNVWECDSVLPSERSLTSETQDNGDYADSDVGDPEPLLDKRRSLSLHLDEEPEDRLASDDPTSDWQTNDTLFRADGSKNSKLRDTIRTALHVSKFDSISSLIASNAVLRRKSVRGKRSRNQSGAAMPGTRRREIVLGKREEPVFVAVLARDRDKRVKGDRGNLQSPARSSTRSKAKTARRAPHIRDLADPDAARQEAVRVCFNCWSASNGRHCDLHEDPRDATRKVRSAESALMCANWELDQLRRKYRAEEIQEIFMKQRASLRYDRKLKQYVTVIECRHPIYRALDQLSTAWNKTMRRKLHTRSWFRSFLEQIRTGRLPRALRGGKDSTRPPSFFKLKNTLQNAQWVSKYSESVANFHPKAPVTAKDRTGTHPVPLHDVIMIQPAKPQLRNWILVTEYTTPTALYKPRVYELPPPRCVPMPVPTFLERLPLPVPNVHLDAGHSASWLERLSARLAIAALQKAALQIGACSPPHGSTDARRTKHVRSLVVLFATFARKPTRGNMDVGGLSAQLLIHMLVTTYIPAQFGNIVVFDRRAVAPAPSRDESVTFVCLVVEPRTPEYVFRALQHALNVRRPPCLVVAARIHLDAALDARRFPPNRPEQTGEEDANGFRTYWLVDPFVVDDAVCGVQVAPSSAILAPNVASMNATVTTRVDRTYPFCVPTTRENTPVEFIHLLWIGQSSRNQPQAFTTLGRQQPGDFMKNSNPDGALGACASVVYRSWAYMQHSPYDEFVTDDGVAYWYDRNTGDTFWTRPVLPVEKFRGKDGDIDGVVTTGEGEVATLGQNLRKYLAKKMEAPADKDRRVKLVTASAKKHDIVLSLKRQQRMSLDCSTKQMIDSITQALGGVAKGANVDMLQLGIGLGMGLGMREEEDDEQADSSRSIAASLLSSRSGYSVAASVDISPTPDDVEFDEGPHVGKKTPGFQTHPPPGEGKSWVRKPVDASGASQTAVEGFGGALHQRVACLPRDFVAAVTSTKTCQMQANYLPVIKNTNQPTSVGIVRPRGALDEWLAIGYSPWTAGRSVFSKQLIADLTLRPELKRDAVSQAVKESEQLETLFSLCRHGKYDEVELLLNSPDWSLGIDAKDSTGNTLLSVACQNNNKRIAKLCLRRGADLNTQNLNGQSLLHYCHEYGFHDLMEYLMDKGARDDLLNADGLTCYEGFSQDAVDAI